MNYTRMQATALRLLQEHGRQLTFTADVVTGYDSATGKETKTTTTYTKYAAQFDYSSYELTLEDIQAGDIRLIAESYAYAKDDTVSIDGSDYRIIRTKSYKPAGTEVAVELQVRK